MKKAIITVLKLSSQEYDDMIMESWLKWCTTHAKNTLAIQKYMICQPLFNWWQNEFQKLEDSTLIDIMDFKIQDVSTRRSLYMFHVAKINSMYSKPLIQLANDTKTVTQQN